MRSVLQYSLLGAAGLAVLLIWRFVPGSVGDPAGDSGRKEATARSTGADSGGSSRPTADPGGGALPGAPNAAQSARDGSAAGVAGNREKSEVDLDLTVVPSSPEDPLARVGGVDLTADDVFPPGVMKPGDKLPKDTLRKFVDDAVNRKIQVLEAERRGFAASPEFVDTMEQLQKDIAALPNLTPQEQEWQAKQIRDMALSDRLFREEGIVSSRLDPKEIESHYLSHSAEYDWVRKREAAKGSSSDKIERRVKDEIRRDLEAPGKREAQLKREKYTESLRQGVKIDLLF